MNALAVAEFGDLLVWFKQGETWSSMGLIVIVVGGALVLGLIFALVLALKGNGRNAHHEDDYAG